MQSSDYEVKYKNIKFYHYSNTKFFWTDVSLKDKIDN